mmetsp:Transcript_8713/g.20314  ORF Transcript_8713/g.20314 Transcript_8713/m.20314 type:complete len:208 (-) Transcript_8713:181-804(-)
MNGIQITINPKSSNLFDDEVLREKYKAMDDELTKATADSERTRSANREDDSLGDDDTLSDDGSFASMDTHTLLSFSTFGTHNMRSVMACGGHLGGARSVGGAVLYTLADATVAVGSVAFQRGRATAEMLSAAIRGNEENATAPAHDERRGSLSSEIKEKMERSRAEREERREQRARRRSLKHEKMRADDLMRARQEIGGLAAAWRQS